MKNSPNSGRNRTRTVKLQIQRTNHGTKSYTYSKNFTIFIIYNFAKILNYNKIIKLKKIKLFLEKLTSL